MHSLVFFKPVRRSGRATRGAGGTRSSPCQSVALLLLYAGITLFYLLAATYIYHDGEEEKNELLIRTSTSGTADTSQMHQTLADDDDLLAAAAAIDPSTSSRTTYSPSHLEDYLLNHMDRLGWNNANRRQARNIKTCAVWTQPNLTTIYSDLQVYRSQLDTLFQATRDFSPIPDLLQALREQQQQQPKDCHAAASSWEQQQAQICQWARVLPEGLGSLFAPTSLSKGTGYGYIEPLLSPMRHPNHCFWADPMNMTYLVHDFEQMCRSLKPHSQRILIDIGASLKVHSKEETWDRVKRNVQPMDHLLELYETFGFRFDHIYAFEATPLDATEVYNDLLPPQYMRSYHWINAGVNATPGSRLNPWDAIVRHLDPDDFVVVKLDIDNASIELPLAQQLLNDPALQARVDQFYFEHHVIVAEMGPWWTNTMRGSVKESFELFRGLRDKGVAAHFWV